MNSKMKSCWQKAFLCLLLSQIIINTFGQKFKIETTLGWATYSMKDLKELNESVLKTYPVKAVITNNFPSRLYYGIAINYIVNQGFFLGLACNYNTTGSRISYKDYSGELKFDHVLSSYSPGFHVAFTINNGKHLRLSEETNISLICTKLKITEEILNEVNKIIFNSKSIGIEPDIVLSYKVKHVEISCKVGYLLDTKSKFKLEGDEGIILKDISTQEVIKNNWSGIRANVSIGLLL